MAKRIIIWVAVILTATGVFVSLQRIKKTEMVQEGRVVFYRKSGDLAQFVVHEVQRYGGTVTLADSQPVIPTEWRYAEDPKGFQILLAQSQKDELIRCLTQLLGEPLRQDKYPHLVYKEDRFGVGIVANLQSDPIHIICLRRGVL